MKKLVQGILLKKINYSETSLILHFFTLEEGFQGFIYQGARKKKRSHPLHALSLLEIECYYRNDSELGKITGVHNRYTFQSVPFDPYKSGVAFFIAEVCHQCLKNPEKEASLFYFLEAMIKELDERENIADFPLIFLIQLTRYLGITPQVETDSPRILDCKEGEIIAYRPTHKAYIEDETVPVLAQALASKEINIKVERKIRRKLLHNLIDYYAYHIDSFKSPKSLQVLETIFS